MINNSTTNHIKTYDKPYDKPYDKLYDKPYDKHPYPKKNFNKKKSDYINPNPNDNYRNQGNTIDSKYKNPNQGTS